ncbi:hypothetical protein E2562_039409 [Oryza meyeriana var. granulata]|uniref:Uncharacterized protein n=1 Tax=Oryza meyeriana var. granulata TaxID=110450 RepID=A0A6G1EUH1_9ORYZ|nr:hypothetical protein E2562_039409 [Oryza meyeriana var. granulata]
MLGRKKGSSSRLSEPNNTTVTTAWKWLLRISSCSRLHSSLFCLLCQMSLRGRGCNE